ASFDLVTLRLMLNHAEAREYARLCAQYRPIVARFMRTQPGSDWQHFLRVARQSREGARAISAWRAARALLTFTAAKRRAVARLLAQNRTSRVLVFTANNQSAYEVARDHLIMPITCEIGRSERRDALQRFSTGELRAIVSAQVLNEGFDLPDA